MHSLTLDWDCHWSFDYVNRLPVINDRGLASLLRSMIENDVETNSCCLSIFYAVTRWLAHVRGLYH